MEEGEREREREEKGMHGGGGGEEEDLIGILNSIFKFDIILPKDLIRVLGAVCGGRKKNRATPCAFYRIKPHISIKNITDKNLGSL